ncbi:DA1, putative [Theobroma cacao]|uniref:DA1, putative n=1 Tax=Theobroma cacao TaxID=3641 RepID=A0A061E1N2_THECC|nr:DA1, putative [Theobroma cacao]
MIIDTAAFITAKDRWQQDEMDDIELATQLSLLDNNDRGKAVPDDIVHEDEDLAKAIEESVRSSVPQSSRRNSDRRQSYQIICDVCDGSIPKKEICKREFWNQHFCRRHVSDGTPICCGCMRLKGVNTEYINLGDVRNICPDCFATSITNARQKQSILDNVIEFLRLKDVEFKGHVPVFLVDRREMRRHTRRGVSTGMEHIQPVHPDSVVWGLTMFNPDESYAESVESLSRSGRNIRLEQRKYLLNHDSHITVLILFGLPKIMTGAIMAHELMHAWFRQLGVFHLEPKVEEGICQVIAHEWLDWFVVMDEEASSSRSENAQFTRNLKHTFKDLVEIDSSHAYGEGFRDAKWAFEKWGPHKVINHVVKYGTLPQ